VPNIQWRTPDVGQRTFPKHVQFLDENKFGKISASVGFIRKKCVRHFEVCLRELPDRDATWSTARALRT